MYPRNAGLLLHLTSLPGPFGIGDLGPNAYRFADFLAASKQSLWQILPVGPIGYGYSPYQSPSTFAGNDLLISPELLLEEGLISTVDVENAKCGSPGDVAFEQATAKKRTLIEHAFATFSSSNSTERQDEFDEFRTDNAYWLDDYSLFAAIKRANALRSWTEWSQDVRERHPDALRSARKSLHHQIGVEEFAQFLFFRQWRNLQSYCKDRSIKIVGDLPIYVAHDSADVWANPELFYLDDVGNPTAVAGVPPDYFSETGQRWGNPIYRWDRMAEDGFAWWTKRVRMILSIVDIVRLDHFRAFDAYWSVPADEETAINGEWVEGPGQAFFDSLRAELGPIPLIAEDLGMITEGVIRLIENNGYPGMAILEFAFDSGSQNKFLPHNYDRNLVAYSGTHDNDTVAGWLQDNKSTQDEETVQRARDYAMRYLGESRTTPLHQAFVTSLYASVANTVVIPVQDILGLGGGTRMNEPGTVENNWRWRLKDDELTLATTSWLANLAETYGR